jgi:hypothetical protein
MAMGGQGSEAAASWKKVVEHHHSKGRLLMVPPRTAQGYSVSVWKAVCHTLCYAHGRYRKGSAMAVQWASSIPAKDSMRKKRKRNQTPTWEPSAFTDWANSKGRHCSGTWLIIFSETDFSVNRVCQLSAVYP